MSIQNLIEKTCKQTAIYWGNPENDGRGGMTFDQPREIKCRWVDKDNVISGPDGKEQASSAEVFVLEDLEMEGYLYLGDFTHITPEQRTNPKNLTGAFSIIRFTKVPSLDNTSYVKKAYLSWRVS